jgi:hypothetical protein
MTVMHPKNRVSCFEEWQPGATDHLRDVSRGLTTRDMETSGPRNRRGRPPAARPAGTHGSAAAACHFGMQTPEYARWTTTPIGKLFTLTPSARALQADLDRRSSDRDRWPPNVWLTDERLIWDGDDGERLYLSFAQVLEVRVRGSDRVLVAGDDFWVVVVGSAYRGGQDLIYGIDSGVAPQVRIGWDGGPPPAVVRPRWWRLWSRLR